MEQRVARALDMVRMAGFAERRPAQLSGGQQQRIALARAMVFEPKLILMDEPLGALDKQLREHMQLEIKHLHERLGINIVYVTHDQGEALTMSDRVGVFNDGIMQQIAPPNELYEAPANKFVAQFIGENNAISGHGARAVQRRAVRARAPTTARSSTRPPATGWRAGMAATLGPATRAAASAAGWMGPAPIASTCPRRRAHLLRRPHALARRGLRRGDILVKVPDAAVRAWYLGPPSISAGMPTIAGHCR